MNLIYLPGFIFWQATNIFFKIYCHLSIGDMSIYFPFNFSGLCTVASIKPTVLLNFNLARHWLKLLKKWKKNIWVERGTWMFTEKFDKISKLKRSGFTYLRRGSLHICATQKLHTCANKLHTCAEITYLRKIVTYLRRNYISAQKLHICA